jgi:hypothetical protein
MQPVLLYDPERRRTLLISGMQSEPFILFNDVWEWDGASWQDVTQSLSHPLLSGYTPAIAFDSRHNRVVQTNMDASVWTGDFESKPALLAAFSLDAIAPPARKLTADEVSIEVRAGASGTRLHAPQIGAMLSIWDGMGWAPAACNDADNSAPDRVSFSTRDPLVIGSMNVRNALRFAVSPKAEHGDGPLATVTTDYVEVRVRYHLGASGAITTERDSFGRASGTCPSVP